MTSTRVTAEGAIVTPFSTLTHGSASANRALPERVPATAVAVRAETKTVSELPTLRMATARLPALVSRFCTQKVRVIDPPGTIVTPENRLPG